TSSPATHAAGTMASTARVISWAASVGLVAKPVLSSGVPASWHRCESSVHDLGRYRARSMRACPRGAASVRYTATWEFSMRPAVPLYWRCTPTECRPFFTSPTVVETLVETSPVLIAIDDLQ